MNFDVHIFVITVLVLLGWLAAGFVFCALFHLLREKYEKSNEEEEDGKAQR